MKFRKKPVVIEAITFTELAAHARKQLDGPAANALFDYANHSLIYDSTDQFIIPTREGNMRMRPDDMLITGVQGELYPCHRSIFDATYEPA